MNSDQGKNARLGDRRFMFKSYFCSWSIVRPWASHLILQDRFFTGKIAVITSSWQGSWRKALWNINWYSNVSHSRNVQIGSSHHKNENVGTGIFSRWENSDFWEIKLLPQGHTASDRARANFKDLEFQFREFQLGSLQSHVIDCLQRWKCEWS